MKLTLDKRLLSCHSFVRQDALFADIGTDHAYLPISLLKSGRIAYAICADINEGPLACARENLLANGLIDKAELVLTNGLIGLEDKGLTDIAICGMGGELIRDIIDAAPFVRDSKINLILQPMSRANVLRAYLLKEGFAIQKEQYVKSLGKTYVTMLVSYTGKKIGNDEFLNLFGTLDKELVDSSADAMEYAEKIYKSLVRIYEGKKSAGVEDTDTKRLIALAKEKIFGEK